LIREKNNSYLGKTERTQAYPQNLTDTHLEVLVTSVYL
jgi:hypothetical protein